MRWEVRCPGTGVGELPGYRRLPNGRFAAATRRPAYLAWGGGVADPSLGPTMGGTQPHQTRPAFENTE